MLSLASLPPLFWPPLFWPTLPETLLPAALALILDAVVGDPPFLYARLPHPVQGFGAVIGFLERWGNRPTASFVHRRLAGVGSLVLLLLLCGSGAALLAGVFAALPGGVALEAALASTLLAQRSLVQHVTAVAAALEQAGLEGGRQAVARIVGRDPLSLDAHGVGRAAVESAAENFSDGLVAPVFWYLLAGLPGLVLYKAVNTADSMIGHRSPRYRAFGWAAARLDDGLNLVPARLAGVLLALTTGRRTGGVLAGMWRDAGLHRSPNAGWPEAAMAAALDLALAGPRRYGAEVVDDPWLNPAGSRTVEPAVIRAAVTRLWRAWSGLTGLVLIGLGLSFGW